MVKTIKWALLSIAFLVIAGAGYYTYSIYHFAEEIQRSPGESIFTPTVTTRSVNQPEIAPPPKWEGRERVNVLLLGGDSRGLKKNEVPRSDTLLVASVDPVTKKGHLLSILRDTYVKIPGHYDDRINTALALGGPDLAMKTVSDFLGIPIQYYVYTDFKGFIALIDAIDGVDFEVEKDMKYSDAEDGHEYDINLKKGFQHLDGKKALQYVRFRHDALSDFTRTERQRNFLQAVAGKMQTTASLLRLPRILSAIDPYVETNLSTTDMLKLASLAYDAKTDGIGTAQIPPQELLESKNIGGAAVLSADKNKIKAYVLNLFNPEHGNDSVGKVTYPIKSSSGTPANTVSNMIKVKNQ
jgi:LCP family protein required for cell wall assembly